jgi:hypothetical protein
MEIIMEIVSEFIANPGMLLLIGLLFIAAYLLLRNRTGNNLRPRALLWPGMAWTLWAAWELGIARFSPEANIRVDLFLIIPTVLILTIVGFVQLFRTPKS